jgi:ribonuclease P protein component
VLERRHRLTTAAGFATAVRRGRRAGSRTLVVHLHRATDGEGLRVGFVVSKAVGPAVVRNRVRRRLRHLVRERVDRLAAADLVVVRALPSAAGASSAELARDLDRCLERVLAGART